MLIKGKPEREVAPRGPKSGGSSSAEAVSGASRLRSSLVAFAGCRGSVAEARHEPQEDTEEPRAALESEASGVSMAEAAGASLAEAAGAPHASVSLSPHAAASDSKAPSRLRRRSRVSIVIPSSPVRRRRGSSDEYTGGSVDSSSARVSPRGSLVDAGSIVGSLGTSLGDPSAYCSTYESSGGAPGSSRPRSSVLQVGARKLLRKVKTPVELAKRQKGVARYVDPSMLRVTAIRSCAIDKANGPWPIPIISASEDRMAAVEQYGLGEDGPPHELFARRLARVYPAGTRVTSDNMSRTRPRHVRDMSLGGHARHVGQHGPAPLLADGRADGVAQLPDERHARPDQPRPLRARQRVRLRAQAAAASEGTRDDPRRPEIRFGYVLKPPELRGGGGGAEWPPFRPNLQRFSVRLLALHRLPTRREQRPALEAAPHHAYESALSGASAPPDPAGPINNATISVELHAIGGFCCVSRTLPLPARPAQRATVSASAAGKSARHSTLHCLAAEPRATVLRACVHDGETVVAYEAVVLGALRPGYRSLSLRSRLGTQIRLCSLLVHIERGEEPNMWAEARELREALAQRDEAIERLNAELAAARLAGPAAAASGEEEAAARPAR